MGWDERLSEERFRNIILMLLGSGVGFADSAIVRLWEGGYVGVGVVMYRGCEVRNSC